MAVSTICRLLGSVRSIVNATLLGLLMMVIACATIGAVGLLGYLIVAGSMKAWRCLRRHQIAYMEVQQAAYGLGTPVKDNQEDQAELEEMRARVRKERAHYALYVQAREEVMKEKKNWRS